MEYELVKRKVSELRADPNQPRKSVGQERIDNLAQTYQSQGIINPIEIDAENVIITGELRWKASKKAGLKEIECKLFLDLDKDARFERQVIENLHHNQFTSEERENAIKKLWESGRYITKEELGNVLGLDRRTISSILKAYNIRKESKGVTGISTQTLSEISVIPKKEERKALVQKVAKKEIEPSKIRSVVKTIKEIEKKAPELKEELFKLDTKITEDKLEKIKQIAELPKDIRKEVVKLEPEITIKEAKEIAEFPEPEQRKAIVKQIKQTKQASKKIIEQKKDIAKGKTERPITVENLDIKFLRIWENIEKDIKIKMRKSFLRPYSEKTKQEAINIAERIVIFLTNEFKQDFTKFKEVKLIGA